MITRGRQVREATDLPETVKAHFDLREVVRRYGIRGNKRGDRYRGWCPFCEKPKEATLSVVRDCYFCHRCSARGSILDWEMATGRCNFKEALKRLAAEAGIPMDAPAESPEQRRARREEKAVCDWWFDRRLEELRAEMERLFWFGPPEPHTPLYCAAMVLRDKILWAERERGTERGMAVFRKAPVTEGAYRRWVAEEKRWEKLWMGLAKVARKPMNGSPC